MSHTRMAPESDNAILIACSVCHTATYYPPAQLGSDGLYRCREYCAADTTNAWEDAKIRAVARSRSREEISIPIPGAPQLSRS